MDAASLRQRPKWTRPSPGGSAGRLSLGQFQANNGSLRDQLLATSLGTIASLANFRLAMPAKRYRFRHAGDKTFDLLGRQRLGVSGMLTASYGLRTVCLDGAPSLSSYPNAIESSG